ncbi:MAG TPA: hypothetical protein VK525_11490 [Candidatus Saccharimonadales bacterium]|nr:hypothetical protein [Candidatus Saccharimonadales bacterium]
MIRKALGIVFVVFLSAPALRAQSNTPIISGAVQFVGTSDGGATFFQPILAPVLVAPIGDHWLIESRADIQGFIARQDGTSGPYQGQFITTLDYFQVDYIANSHLTVSAGRFLTPFNIFDERFTAVWVRNFQDPPIIFPIGTRTSGSSNGAMVRGVVVAKKKWEMNYTAFFSAAMNTDHLEAGRSAGGRLGVFVPESGLELGVSYERFLQQDHYNAVGTYLSWQPTQLPLDLRAEYAHSPGGQGYWLEGAYRLAKQRGTTTGLARLQAIARVQQYFKGVSSPGDSLPSTDTKRVDFGLNYYLPHDLRLNGSYGRQFSSIGNANVWNFQITYRFMFPLLPGASR